MPGQALPRNSFYFSFLFIVLACLCANVCVCVRLSLFKYQRFLFPFKHLLCIFIPPFIHSLICDSNDCHTTRVIMRSIKQININIKLNNVRNKMFEWKMSEKPNGWMRGCDENDDCDRNSNTRNAAPRKAKSMENSVGCLLRSRLVTFMGRSCHGDSSNCQRCIFKQICQK